jgi:hypothetical protein
MGSQGRVQTDTIPIFAMNRRFLISMLICPLLVLVAGCSGDVDEQAAAGTNGVVSITNTPVAVPVAPPVVHSAGASNILRMVQAGMDAIVIRNQILVTRGAYDLSPTDLVWLTEQGVSQDLISLVIQHDQQIQEEARQAEMVRTQAVARVQREARLRKELEAARAALAKRPVAPPKAKAIARNAGGGLPAQVRPFHEALAPYGAWVNHQQYGLVWQPKVLRQRAAWRPYADNGRWLATEQGWYWHSEYPWGWAVFHYGRWGFDRQAGWYWVPDTVWGPSWVTFRMNGQYVGWAPLPPGAVAAPNVGVTFNGRPVGTGFNYGLSSAYYSFVPTAQAFHQTLPTFLLARPLVPGVFPRTTVINNIIIGDGNTVINNGIPISHLDRSAPGPVRLTRIQSAREYSVDQFGAIIRNGDRSTVFRPALAHIAPVKPAVMRQGGSNVAVFLPKAAPDDVVIAGEPVVDRSTGVPVVTGYRTRPTRRYSVGAVPVGTLPVGQNQRVGTSLPVTAGRVVG